MEKNGRIFDRRIGWALIILSGLFAMTYVASVSAGYLALFLLFPTALAGAVVSRVKFRFSDYPFVWPFLAYAGWGLVASLCGNGVATSLYHWRSDFIFITCWLLCLTFRLKPESRRWAILAYSAGMAFLAVSGIVQFVLIHWYPQANQWMVNSSIGVIHRFALLQDHGLRVHGPVNTMTYAEVMGLAGLVMIGLWPGRFWIGAALSAICLSALLASASRGAALGMAAGMLVLAATMVRRRWQSIWRAVLPLGAACGILLISPSVWGRLKTTFNPEQNMDRLVMWRVGLNLLRDHPLTGIGISQTRAAWPVYFHKEWKQYFPYQDIWSDVHNLYLQQAAERGLPGLVILLIVAGSMTWWCARTWRRRPPCPWKEFHAGIFAAIVGFWVMNITESAFQDVEVVMTVYFLLALAWTAEDTVEDTQAVK
ncbi:MAG: O-antigen ligase family protein [Elusimicrobiota bacterium]